VVLVVGLVALLEALVVRLLALVLVLPLVLPLVQLPGLFYPLGKHLPKQAKPLTPLKLQLIPQPWRRLLLRR
jgi:hypothetical protein